MKTKNRVFSSIFNNRDNINDDKTCQSDIFKNRALLYRIELNESYWLIYETAQKYCYELDIDNNKKEF
jgi:hypothetical protein